MRHTLVSLAALCALVTPALAEPMAAHAQPTPQAVGPADGQPNTKTGAGESAQSRSEEVFRRVSQRSAAAIRSICLGCDGPASAPKPVAHKPVRVRPTISEEAPTEAQ